MFYDPDAKGTHAPPRWTYLLCGIGLFIYQTLDAIGEFDGVVLKAIIQLPLLQMESRQDGQDRRRRWANFLTTGKTMKQRGMTADEITRVFSGVTVFQRCSSPSRRACLCSSATIRS